MDMVTLLETKGIQPSAQRVAVAKVVLSTDRHPTAEEVHRLVKARSPEISRATIYNTLNLFVEKGLLRALTLVEGRVVYDPMMERHHHFIDEESGDIHDLPWEAFRVEKQAELSQFEIRALEVVVRGRRTKRS
jgi:Fe2+ or Zn2+ uptake regulation protein